MKRLLRRPRRTPARSRWTSQAHQGCKVTADVCWPLALLSYEPRGEIQNQVICTQFITPSAGGGFWRNRRFQAKTVFRASRSFIWPNSRVAFGSRADRCRAHSERLRRVEKCAYRGRLRKGRSLCAEAALRLRARNRLHCTTRAFQKPTGGLRVQWRAGYQLNRAALESAFTAVSSGPEARALGFVPQL